MALRTLHIILIANIFLWLNLAAYAANGPGQTVRGKIIDLESGAHLAGVSVYLADLEPVLGTISNEKGEFRIEHVPTGRHDLVVAILGYEKKQLSGILISSGKEYIVNIELTETVVQMETVSINPDQGSTPNNELAVVSARSFSVEQSGRFAASVNDPARLALSFAGVSTQNDATNEIVIRGNSPKGLLWMLEGVEIPNPNHLSGWGASGGGLSMLSNNVLGRSDFFTGAFPANYGNALSGVFDLRLRRGNNEQVEVAAQASGLGLAASVEGPFSKKKKSSFLINYRYSTLGLLQQLGYKLMGDLETSFQDINFKIQVPTAKAGIFSLFGIGGMSGARFAPDMELTYLHSFIGKTRQKYGYNMGVTGLSHKILPDRSSWLRTTVAIMGDLYYSQQSLWLEDQQTAQPVGEDRFSELALRATSVYNRKLNAQNSIRLGGNIHFINSFSRTGSLSTKHYSLTSNAQPSQRGHVFSVWRVRPSPTLTLISGAHASYFWVNREFVFEPRIAVNWQWAPRQQFSWAAGLHSRQEPTPIYYFVSEEKQQNTGIPITKAWHGVFAWQFDIAPQFYLRTESYFQYLFDVPVQGPSNPVWSMLNRVSGSQNAIALSGVGSGINYGLEFTLEKNFARNYYFLLTTSLYQSKYKTSDNIYRDTRFNGNFVANATGGKDFEVGKKRPGILSLNAKILWAGGRRLIPFNMDQSQRLGFPIYDYSQGYIDRASNYFRLDFRASYRMNLPGMAWEVALDIQNVTNHRNMFNRYFNPETGEIGQIDQMGTLPNLRIRFEF